MEVPEMAGISKAERERRAKAKADEADKPKVDSPDDVDATGAVGTDNSAPVDAVTNAGAPVDGADVVAKAAPKGDDVVSSPADAVDHAKGAPASPGGAVSTDATPPVTTQADGSVGINPADEAEAFRFDVNAFGEAEAKRRRKARDDKRATRKAAREG